MNAVNVNDYDAIRELPAATSVSWYSSCSTVSINVLPESSDSCARKLLPDSYCLRIWSELFSQAQRQQAFDAKDFKIAGMIGEEINMRVIEFNLDHPKEGKYLDLHYMTEKEAAGRHHAFDAKDFKIAGMINEEINMRVIEFNLTHPKEDNYLDSHYMTEERAVTFMAMMCNGNHGLWKMEDPLGTEPRIHIMLFRNNSEMVDNGWY
ncbi:hypothetical protein CAEBREN_15851 [Caenorhabditis brenneri]|uniref:Uncharacterized protein n=1 Tax=Caenorhabditis brenneri TaxID=135651 RepID=G0P0C6_CAEBE|nr:hypothetical protein CAEBREN_15851 [Caenorhabditis brenneri]